ncbi:MAG: hypothetical protein H6858_09270 [Rhodospirillales bacterium]|nr:hypothetical protein [Alphaproteobacteria bacterium]MCB1839681.1 hypothetical protein [Alphaproteobacteria bacterium]MCB9977774.1 hypothetical protein [Rhodospirillales bacterium]
MSLERNGNFVMLDEPDRPGTVKGWIGPGHRDHFTLAAGQPLPEVLRPFLEESTLKPEGPGTHYTIEADGGFFGVILDDRGTILGLG